MTDRLDQTAKDTSDYVRDNRMAWLQASWSDDYVIFTSAHGRYWCARFRYPIPVGLLLMGMGHPDATVIADSAPELDAQLDAQRGEVAAYRDRLSLRSTFLERPGVCDVA